MYNDYNASFAWERFKVEMARADPIDMMDMQVMSDMMMIMPKMTEMKGILADLTIIMKDLYLRLILVSLCSFRTPVNLIYTYLTCRHFSWSYLTYVDIAILGYCTYFLTVFE